MMNRDCQRKSGPLWMHLIMEDEELEESRGWRWLPECNNGTTFKPSTNANNSHVFHVGLHYRTLCCIVCRCAGEGRVRPRKAPSWRNRRTPWWKCQSRSMSHSSQSQRSHTRSCHRTGSGTRPFRWAHTPLLALPHPTQRSALPQKKKASHGQLWIISLISKNVQTRP